VFCQTIQLHQLTLSLHSSCIQCTGGQEHTAERGEGAGLPFLAAAHCLIWVHCLSCKASMPPSQHHLLMGAVSGARLEKLPEVSTLFREQYANTGGSPPPLQPTLALRGPKAPPGQLQPRKAYRGAASNSRSTAPLPAPWGRLRQPPWGGGSAPRRPAGHHRAPSPAGTGAEPSLLVPASRALRFVSV